MLVLGLLGCSSSPPPEARVTWHRDIAPIISTNCAGCHSKDPNSTAPFPLTTYDEVAEAGSLVAWAVQSKSMPPWPAQTTEECVPPFPFQGDLQLSDSQITAIVHWVEDQMPPGDPTTAAPLPETLPPPSLDTWDTELETEPAWTPTRLEDEYVCYALPTGLQPGEQRWVRAFEVVPGPTPPVHHALLYTAKNFTATQTRWPCFGGAKCTGTAEECEGLEQLDYSLFGAWAPGTGPTVFPAEEPALTSGYPVSGDDVILMQVHYSPQDLTSSGGRTKVRLKWQEETPTYAVELRILGAFKESGPDAFSIPPQTSNFTVSLTRKVGAHGVIWGVIPHQHTFGTSIKVSLKSADSGAEQCLVNVPTWDFDWQRLYSYDYDSPFNLPPVARDDELLIECSYSNPTSSPVHTGESTLEEMCLTAVGIVTPL